jgi:hypothetical protein
MNWGIFPRHSSSERRAKKANSITRWTFDSMRKYESYSTGEEKDFD